jgi:hypothetical protein
MLRRLRDATVSKREARKTSLILRSARRASLEG